MRRDTIDCMPFLSPQESKLYYDADLGSYYHYDKDAKTYTLHSRVQLPEHLLRKRKREKKVEIVLISDDEFNGKSF